MKKTVWHFGAGQGEFPSQIRGFHGLGGSLLCWLPFLCGAGLRGQGEWSAWTLLQKAHPFLQASASKVWSEDLLCLCQDP